MDTDDYWLAWIYGYRSLVGIGWTYEHRWLVVIAWAYGYRSLVGIAWTYEYRWLVGMTRDML